MIFRNCRWRWWSNHRKGLSILIGQAQTGIAVGEEQWGAFVLLFWWSPCQACSVLPITNVDFSQARGSSFMGCWHLNLGNRPRFGLLFWSSVKITSLLFWVMYYNSVYSFLALLSCSTVLTCSFLGCAAVASRQGPFHKK